MRSKKLSCFIIGIAAVFYFASLSCSSADLPAPLKSPDGYIVLQFNLTEKGEASYNIGYKNDPIIKESRLGFEFLDIDPLNHNLKAENIKRKTHNETYSVIYGTEKEISDHYNEMTLALKEQGDSQRKFDLVFRAYDDGVAFRYVLKDLGDIDQVAISKEKTEFEFADDDSAYTLNLGSFTTNYETNYTKVALNNVGADAVIGLPILVETAHGLFVAITEANLTDYAGMYLSGSADNPASLRSVLSPLPDGGGGCVKGKLPLKTPWRVIMIADHPGRLIESNIILNLNEPCAIDDPSWIKPGKAAWDWWANRTVTGVDFEGGMNTATMKHYIRFAGEIGLEYMLIDAGWYGNHHDPNEDITTTIPQIDMPEIVQYAQSKGVDVLLWVNWQCVKRQMDVAFPLYEKWGVKGIKVDYMDRDDQEMVNYYHDVVKNAAEHHLVVDFHGAYKPTGIRRTYPNLLTREGVLGQEYSKWSFKCSPEHDVTIPFVRMLAGPMDFTPGAFRTATREAFNPRVNPPVAQGTRCHQLAMYVVYESPLQMCVDYPGAYRGETGLEFLKHVPTTWDKTKVVNGEVGDYITIARKHKNEWYVGSMTDWTARTIEIPLTFLGNSDYVAYIFSDGPDADRIPNSVATLKVLVNSADTITANLAYGGGQAIRLVPAPSKTTLPRYGSKVSSN